MNLQNTAPETSADPLAVFATAEFRKDPYPYLRTLRETSPVHRTAAGFHLVTRHGDATTVARLSGDLVRSPDREQLAEQYPWASKHPSMAFRLDHMLFKNPPEHTRLRRVIAQDFTPRRVRDLRGEIERICANLLAAVEEPLREGGVADLHDTLSKPLSLQVISGLLGVPESDRAWMSEVVINFVASFAGIDEKLMAVADRRIVELQDYFGALLAERRRTPRPDLLSALVGVNDQEPDRLDDAELMGMVLLLWIAGFETTAAAIDFGVLSMVEFPDQRHWLRGGEDGRLAYADEVLRRTGPAIFTPIPRFTTREVTLSGVTLPPGSDLRPVFAAANRDPEVFPDPDRFDPSRNTGPTLAFSQGIHHCLGSFLARTEMTVALSGLHERFPDLVPAGEPEWATALPMHAPVSLPVSL